MPRRAQDFSPTFRSIPCGVNGKGDPMKSCKDDTNTNHIYNATCNNIYYRSFRTSLQTTPITPHSATLHVGLKSFAPSGHLQGMPLLLWCLFYALRRKCPERAKDFSPTCSAAECGVKEDTAKGILKG
ncbi:hypothetical protein Barb4_01475 [Bacteroidales bacterium Barb4]|nr:hypothetical protein Barb4_01475 [Bacteroidales bacterium Barb4]